MILLLWLFIKSYSEDESRSELASTFLILTLLTTRGNDSTFLTDAGLQLQFGWRIEISVNHTRLQPNTTTTVASSTASCSDWISGNDHLLCKTRSNGRVSFLRLAAPITDSVSNTDRCSNIQGIIQGQIDTPLNDHGRSEARLLATRLKDTKFDEAWSSSLSRAREVNPQLKDSGQWGTSWVLVDRRNRTSTSSWIDTKDRSGIDGAWIREFRG